MNTKNCLWGALGASCLLVSGTMAQPTINGEQTTNYTFEENADNWLPLGDNAHVSLTTEPQTVKDGQGALRFDYQVAPRAISALISPVAPGTMTNFKALGFWIRATNDCSLILALNEKGGGRFASFFSLKKDKWQRVEATPSDFVLLMGKDDPKDANGKLDSNKIEAIALADFNQILLLSDDAGRNPLLNLLGVQPGKRTVFLDDIDLIGKTPPQDEPGNNAVNTGVDIDLFKSPQVAWIGLGDVAMERVDDANPQDDGTRQSGLRADYKQSTGRVMVLGKPIEKGTLTGKSKLTFNVSSLKRAMLVVQVEEESGGKYNTTVEVPPLAEPIAVEAILADFKPASDSKDNNDQLDLDEVKQLLILDVTGLVGIDEGANTLWVSRVRAQ